VRTRCGSLRRVAFVWMSFLRRRCRMSCARRRTVGGFRCSGGRRVILSGTIFRRMTCCGCFCRRMIYRRSFCRGPVFCTAISRRPCNACFLR
jgi:hypothetical protein